MCYVVMCVITRYMRLWASHTDPQSTYFFSISVNPLKVQYGRFVCLSAYVKIMLESQLCCELVVFLTLADYICITIIAGVNFCSCRGAKKRH